MATSAMAQHLIEQAPPKKGKRGGRKPLNQKDATNEANILAGNIPTGTATSSFHSESDPQKENLVSSSVKKSKATGKSKSKQAVAIASLSSPSTFEKEMQEMQQMLEKLKIEKEKTEGLLKEKDEMLRVKDEELENRGKEQEKLQVELKKLQKMKEFKPTLDLPMFHSLAEKDLDKKKKKGCNETKKPATPYLLWSKDQWNEVKKTNPEADFKEISTIVGAKWKALAPEEKKPYEERYQAEKEAYLKVVSKEKRENEAMKLLEEEQKQRTAVELLEQYLQFKQEAEKKETKKSKKEKDPLKPKQPVSAFFLFINERRADLLKEGKNLLEVSKIMGEEWNNMSEKKKKPYEERARENKENYLHEMEVYKQKKDEESANSKREEEEQMKLQKHEALQLLKKKEKNENMIKQVKEQKKQKKQQKEEKNIDPNKPKRPLSSYFLFSKEVRKNLLEERPGINNSTLNALISVKWKELSEEEKQVWNKKAAESMEAYKKEMEQYNKMIAVAEPSSRQNEL